MRWMAAKIAQLSMLSRTKTAKMITHYIKCGLSYAERMTWACLPVLWDNLELEFEYHKNKGDDLTKSL